MAQDNTSKLLWFTAGLAIGATIAILYAPVSGEQTRRKIRRKAEESIDSLKEKGEGLMERGRELYGKGREIADEAAELFERGRKLVQG